MIIKENLHFKQLQLNYINYQKNKPKKHLRLVISSIRVGVVAKTDHEIYALSTIKIWSYFSSVFSTVQKKFELLKIWKVIYLLWKMLPPCKNGREEDNYFFSQSLLHSVVFQIGKYQVFWSSFGSCPLQLSDQFNLPPRTILEKKRHWIILPEIFTWFDLSVVNNRN